MTLQIIPCPLKEPEAANSQTFWQEIREEKVLFGFPSSIIGTHTYMAENGLYIVLYGLSVLD